MESTSANPNERSANRRRWTFSLRALLVGVALVALTIEYVHTSRDLRRAKVELARLRKEVGELTIEDEQRVYVITVPTVENDTWQWRLYLPNNAQLRWGMAHELIPPTGLPQAKDRNLAYYGIARPGEQLVRAKLYRNADRIWLLSVKTRDGTMTYSPGSADVAWLDGAAFFETQFPGLPGTQGLDSGQPLVLLRHRVVKHDSLPPSRPRNSPGPGFMIWLEPVVPGPPGTATGPRK